MRPWIVAVFALAVLMPGCLRDFDEPRANFLNLVKIDVSAPTVTSGSVVLAVNATLDNTESESGEVRLVVKAYDTATSLLVVTNETTVGKIAKDKTITSTTRIVVPRASGYNLDIAVYQDDQLVQAGQVSVWNVGGLQPNRFDTGLSIGQIDFLVQNVTDRIHIEAKVYITNEARAVAKELRMQVKAREISTGLLSDEETTTVAGILPEETRVFSVNLTVPNRYNYEIEVVLWDGNFVVERGSGHVQLLPTFTKPKDEELVVSQPNITDFSYGFRAGLTSSEGVAYDTGGSYAPKSGGGYNLPMRGPGYSPESPQPAVPGVGALAAIGIVALAALVLARRRSR